VDYADVKEHASRKTAPLYSHGALRDFAQKRAALWGTRADSFGKAKKNFFKIEKLM
jgi:hypothetical protein